MSKSIVEYYPEKEKVGCGYCKNTNCSFSYGMWAHVLTVDDYQNLIDRGWRRSGKYCYKPKIEDTCCPLYTISCSILDFKLSKSQKKILKKANKFLCNEKMDDGNSSDIVIPNSNPSEIHDSEMCILDAAQAKSLISVHVENIRHISGDSNASSEPIKELSTESKENIVATMIPTRDIPKNAMGADPNKSPCKKAKLIRLERKEEKLRLKGETNQIKKHISKEKSIEDFINELPESIQKRLQLKLVRTSPPSAEWESTAKISHKLYTKYQISIHGDTQEKCSEKQFLGFLVKSPLEAAFPKGGPPLGYGSFHQQYWLDGELIAVGVIDILPKCISSVYFFYDPQYSYLTLGTYGALREITLTRQLQVETSNIKHYYMGFYIHSCPKMRYKGNYHPSYLLCPETFDWFPIEDCLVKLNEFPYPRLNPDIDAVDSNSCEKKDLDNILVLVGNTYMKYSIYKANNYPKSRTLISALTPKESIMLEYAKLVGMRCSRSMILVKE